MIKSLRVTKCNPLLVGEKYYNDKYSTCGRSLDTWMDQASSLFWWQYIIFRFTAYFFFKYYTIYFSFLFPKIVRTFFVCVCVVNFVVFWMVNLIYDIYIYVKLRFLIRTPNTLIFVYDIKLLLKNSGTGLPNLRFRLC